jgi:hypothetical protein
VIEFEFAPTKGAEAVGFSHGDFGFVVQTLKPRRWKEAFEHGNSSGYGYRRLTVMLRREGSRVKYQTRVPDAPRRKSGSTHRQI